MISLKLISSYIKNNHQFCTIHGLKQLIKCPTRVTCSTSNRTIASFPSRVSQKGITEVGISNHQLIFCTQKKSRLKQGGIRKYLNFGSLKNYTVNFFKEFLKQPLQSLSENNDCYRQNFSL